MYTWKTEPSFFTREAVWSGLAVIEVLLGMRFFFKLLGPYSVGVIEDITYSITGYLLVPFTAVTKVPLQVALNDQVIFEWITLLSIVSYGLLAVGLLALLKLSSRVSKIEIARALSQKKYGRSQSFID